MLKVKLEGQAQEFAGPISELAAVAGVAISPDGLPLSVQACDNGLAVRKKEGRAEISYSKRHEFFRGLMILIERQQEAEFEIAESPRFQFDGAMIDNSRNAVMTTATAKNIIMYSALFGLDHILLYNEDTFEVDENPYFGYMRMGYSQAEVRELNDFAKQFGVELVPCVQTLAHLGTMLRWQCYNDICDYGDTMLVEEEKTYQLVENIIKSWRKCVDTDIINIGMDEAYFLGRGKFMDKKGVKPRFELMCEHLKRVLAICEKYGFKPMMWSDMFFTMVYGSYYEGGDIDESLLALVPKGVTLVYWDYYSTDKDRYDQVFKKHLRFNNPVGFAGGARKWQGFVPNMKHSHFSSRLALEAASENGIQTVFTTAWGDNGAEASVYTILPNLCLFGEMRYSDNNSDESVSAKLKALTGYTLAEFFELDSPNLTDGGVTNPSKYLFFQDPLMGLFDYHVGTDYPARYAACRETLAALAGRDATLSFLFKTLAALSDFLELKCDLGVRLKEAYENKDTSSLQQYADEVIPTLLNRLEAFYRLYKKQWYSESNPGGFDVQDLRFGGLRQRILTAQETLRDYLAGIIPSIRELEEPRLPFDCRKPEEEKPLEICYNYWNHNVTANVNAWY